MNELPLSWLRRVGHIGGKSKTPVVEEDTGSKGLTPGGGSELGKF